MTIKEEMNEIIEDFELFDDWEDKYGYLIELGRKLEPLEDKYKNDENKVTGCTSQVWLVSYKKDGEPDKYYFKADSDAYIVKGLIALLLKVFSGKKGEEIKSTDIEGFFNEIGLRKHLSPNRSNGFFSMVQKIKELC